MSQLPAIVTMEEVKLWMRRDDDYLDAEFQLLLDAATEAVLVNINPTVYQDKVPARLKLAVLAHINNAYMNRENGADLPASAHRLLNPLRTLDI